MKVFLPRTFHGPISVSTKHGPISFSDALKADIVSVGSIRFLGSFEHYDKKTWEGDEAVVETKNGPVKLMYDDEPDDMPNPIAWIQKMLRKV
jgi:hypothetical protein